jgi:transcriptional regulator with GAF, ATPase, and Fis domain
MEYNTLGQNAEKQKTDQDITEKLFRYSALVEAIDFFSQQLNSEQIVDAAFDFINEMLQVECSALYCIGIDQNYYERRKAKGFCTEPDKLKAEGSYDEFAKFHGSILYNRERMTRYFEAELLDAYRVKMIIPLIVEHSLFGFILISNKTMGDYNDNDHVISEVLMKLINTALSNYKRYEILKKTNLSLDEKIFNLFAINQSSRALLSELNLNNLYSLSVDVFSELTQSSVTGFVLFDEKSEKYVLKAFKDIYYGIRDIYMELSLNRDVPIKPDKLIIDVSNDQDKEYFNTLFEEGIEVLCDLKPLYLVLLVSNSNILGFVSLSCTVTGIEYKNSVFELIESMASSTFISLSNASLFTQVMEQKKYIQNKLDNLINLNNLIKNINNSTRMDILIEMTLKTLNVSFGVRKAFIALYDNESNHFNIASSIGFQYKEEIELNQQWEKVLEGGTVLLNSEIEVYDYFDKNLIINLGKISGTCIVPIYIDKVETELLGILTVFSFEKTRVGEEENQLILESIAGHIAPVLSNLYTLEEQQKFLLPNHIELFKKSLKYEINLAKEYSLELEVLEITDCRDFLFKEDSLCDKLKNRFSKIYPFSYNNIFILDNEVTEEVEGLIHNITGVDSLKVKQLVYNKDFCSYTEFFQLF